MIAMTDDEMNAMPWTSQYMTKAEFEAWVASREEAGSAIDIATCEIGCWAAYDCAPYNERELSLEMRQSGFHHFVRSPTSSGWVHELDLPGEKLKAIYRRMDLNRELRKAAAEKHPGWALNSASRPVRINDKAPEYDELIVWFSARFPDEARVIEAAAAFATVTGPA